MILIIPCNARQVFTRSIVSNILNKHILNTSAGRDTILRIETDSEIHKLSVTKIFNPNILERNITHQCIVAWIYSQTSLIINLFFCLIKNVDIPKSDVLHRIHAVRISMSSDIDWMSHISPKCRIFHQYIIASPFKSLRRSINCGTVITITTENPI